MATFFCIQVKEPRSPRLSLHKQGIHDSCLHVDQQRCCRNVGPT